MKYGSEDGERRRKGAKDMSKLDKPSKRCAKKTKHMKKILESKAIMHKLNVKEEEKDEKVER